MLRSERSPRRPPCPLHHSSGRFSRQWVDGDGALKIPTLGASEEHQKGRGGSVELPTFASQFQAHRECMIILSKSFKASRQSTLAPLIKGSIFRDYNFR